MESYFIKYKPFLLFLAKFFGVYLFLILGYQVYLKQFDVARFEADFFTQMVANHTEWVLSSMNYEVSLRPHLSEPSVVVLMDQKSVVRVVEGCNGVSVLILFVSFIIAFSGKFWNTLGFIIFGIILIHVLNVLRIAFLILGLLYYSAYENVLHDIVFPLFIYGVVFSLWIFWVNKFSGYAKKAN